MYCKKCGNHLLEYEKACPQCGEEVVNLEVINTKDTPEKNQLIYILSIVFGVCSIVVWFLWIYLGYIISIAGIFISIKAIENYTSANNTKLGLILNIMGLVLTLLMHSILVL